MRIVLSTIGQMAVLLVLASLVGLATNPIRGKNRISLERDYRPKPVPTRPDQTSKPAPEPTVADTTPELKPAASTAESDDANSEPNAVAATPPGMAEDPNQGSPFQVIDIEEVREVYLDDRTQYGLNVFVDARADGPFEAGHIPGAVQCDYYRLDFYIDSVLARAAGAEKVIVYCNGGDCEDSLHVCGELLNYEIPWHSIYLFKGGWEAWKETELPVETGPEGGS